MKWVKSVTFDLARIDMYTFRLLGIIKFCVMLGRGNKSNPHPPKVEGGSCKAPCDFFPTTFWASDLCNLYKPYNASIHNMHRNLGGVVWVGGVVKLIDRSPSVGGWGLWNSMILTLPITKIFDKIYSCNLVCGLELAFPYLFYQKCGENCIFICFCFSRKSNFAYYLCIFWIYVWNFEGGLSLLCHSDVIRRPMIHFWYQYKEETHSYCIQ